MEHSQNIQEEPPQPLSCFPGICSSYRGSLIPRKSVPLKDKHVNQKQQAFYRCHWIVVRLMLQVKWDDHSDPLELEAYDSMLVFYGKIQ